VKILVDMSLSPDWAAYLTGRGYESLHWSHVGDPQASDRAILSWARANQYLVLTHDLDFGTLLATVEPSGPSVIQLRSQDVMPDRLGEILLAALQSHREALESGALVTVDPERSRVRILPIRR
jgi:predicted nuclease of predicted toxin-antitoxin system